MRRLAPLAALLLAAAALAAASAPSADAACGAARSPRHVAAVFGYDGTPAAAEARANAARRHGFRFVRVRQVDCGIWEVAVDGLDTPSQQAEFAREASRSGLPGVSYDTLHGPPPPSRPGTVRAVFGRFAAVAPANARLQRAAGAGFRIINLLRRGDAYTVEVLGIPFARSREFAAQARAAGLPVSFELG